jgi:hypothetical protein
MYALPAVAPWCRGCSAGFSPYPARVALFPIFPQVSASTSADGTEVFVKASATSELLECATADRLTQYLAWPSARVAVRQVRGRATRHALAPTGSVRAPHLRRDWRHHIRPRTWPASAPGLAGSHLPGTRTLGLSLIELVLHVRAQGRCSWLDCRYGGGFCEFKRERKMLFQPSREGMLFSSRGALCMSARV